jgi:cytochrome c oxidase subunit 2
MNSETVNMKAVAGYLAIGMAVVVALLWTAPWDSGDSTKAAGGATAVKVDKALASEGEQVSTANGCTSCHTIDGNAGAGPTWQGMFGSTGKQGGTVDEKYIVAIMAKPPAAMANFQGKISPAQAKAIAEYIKSLQ